MSKMIDIVPGLIEKFDNNKDALLPVKGTSMLPLFNEENTIVNLERKEDYFKNDIVLYLRKDGHYVLHRIYEKDNEVFSMIGDHQVKIESGINKNQIICGVKNYYKDNKLYTMKNIKYKLYEFFWKCIRIRKIYFKISKI